MVTRRAQAKLAELDALAAEDGGLTASEAELQTVLRRNVGNPAMLANMLDADLVAPAAQDQAQVPEPQQPEAPSRAVPPTQAGIVAPLTPSWVNQETGEDAIPGREDMRAALESQMQAQFAAHGNTAVDAEAIAYAWQARGVDVSPTAITKVARAVRKTFTPAGNAPANPENASASDPMRAQPAATAEPFQDANPESIPGAETQAQQGFQGDDPSKGSAIPLPQPAPAQAGSKQPSTAPSTAPDAGTEAAVQADGIVPTNDATQSEIAGQPRPAEPATAAPEAIQPPAQAASPGIKTAIHLPHYKRDVSPSDLVKTKNMNGKTVFVHKDALADESATLLPMYTSSGKQNNKQGRHQTIHRENLDPDGSKRATRPGLPYYASTTRTGEKPFKTAKAAQKAVTDDGQSLDDYEITASGDGFVAVRKSDAEARPTHPDSRLGQPPASTATHIEPGQPPQPATPAVVAEAEQVTDAPENEDQERVATEAVVSDAAPVGDQRSRAAIEQEIEKLKEKRAALSKKQVERYHNNAASRRRTTTYNAEAGRISARIDALRAELERRDAAESAQAAAKETAVLDAAHDGNDGAQSSTDLDWLDQLMSGNATAQKAEPELQEALDTAVRKLETAADSFAGMAEEVSSRVYKTRKGGVQFDGDGPARDGFASFTSINEGRRRRMIASHRASQKLLLIAASRLKAGRREFAEKILKLAAEWAGDPHMQGGEDYAWIWHFLSDDDRMAIGGAYGPTSAGGIVRRVMLDYVHDVDAALGHAQTKEEAGATSTKPAQLDDFGEKLEGARKDLPPSLKEELSDDQIASQPLSKIWPADAHEGIEDDAAAALTFAARAEIPAKPRVAHKLRRWVEQVKMLRDMVRNPDDAKLFIRTGESDSRFSSLGGFFAKVRLLSQLPREHWKRVGKVAEYPSAHRYKDGKQVAAPFSEVQIDGKSHRLPIGKIGPDEVQKVLELLGAAAPAKDSLTAKDFEIRMPRGGGSAFINRKGDKEYRPLKTFTGDDAVKQARAWLKDHVADAEAEWEAVKARDNIAMGDERRDENRERTGPNRRNGKDVTPEMFNEAFGFRGTQFGNYVKQGKGAKDRQGMLNDAYDALLDLAELLGIPSRAISLNGTLGLAFGARGSGRAGAHFEPSNLVINLTKTRGAGSLAHEWFHALDNYFSRMRRDGKEHPMGTSQDDYRRNNYITYRPEPVWTTERQGKYGPMRDTATSAQLRQGLQSSGQWVDGKTLEENAKAAGWSRDAATPEGVRVQVETAFAELTKALNASPMASRALAMSKGKSEGYWNQIIERGARSFENYILSKMAQRGWSNDFLANIRDWQDWQDSGKNAERYPYLKPEEEAPIVEAFDNLFETIESRTDPETGNVALFNRVGRAAPGSSPIPRSRLDSLVDHLTRNQPDGKARVRIASRWVDLPAEVRDEAERQGFDPVTETIPGVAYKGDVYLVHEYLTSEKLVEETLFHERVHQVLRNNTRDPDSSQLRSALQSLYTSLGGRDGLRRAATQAGVSHRPSERQGNALRQAMLREAKAQGTPELLAMRQANVARNVLTMEEFLADLEGGRAYENVSKTLQRKFHEALGRLRQWLRDHGFARLAKALGQDLNTANLADLRALLWGIRQQVAGTGDSAVRFIRVWHGTPHRGIEREFLAELPEDADFADVVELLGTGAFSPKNEAVLRALADADWLGFDYPAQALSAALSSQINNFDPTPALVRAVSDAQEGGTHNYVIWDEALLTPKKAQIKPYYSRAERRDDGDADIRAMVEQYANVDGAPTEAEIREAITQYRDTERAYGGRPAYDKAKADGRTKLTYGQWVQVRTPNFKRWFGDWMNDPANASKVVDPETGEPMVVYHGTDRIFNTFRANEAAGFGLGIYLTDNFEQARDEYAWEGGRVVHGFVNIKNPSDGGIPRGVDFDSFDVDRWGEDGSYAGRLIRESGHDGIIARWSNNILGLEIVAFAPNQIKSATANIGTFNGNTGDIRFSQQDQSGPSFLTRAADVQAAVLRVLDTWKGDKPVVRVVQSMAEARKQGAKLPADAPSDVEGWWDGDSTVWIVAGNNRDVARALETLSHEAIGHYGIERVMGKEAWTRLVADVKRLRGLKQSDVSPKIWKALQSAERRYGNESAETFAKEFLAIMAEQGVRSGLTMRVVAKIRQLLAKLGIPMNISKAFREAELLDALYRGRKRVTQAPRGQAASTGRPAREMAFSQSTPTFYSAMLDAVSKAQGVPKKGEATIRTEGNGLGDTQSVYALDLTPKMRDAALAGLPLFSRKDDATQIPSGVGNLSQDHLDVLRQLGLLSQEQEADLSGQAQEDASEQPVNRWGERIIPEAEARAHLRYGARQRGSAVAGGTDGAVGSDGSSAGRAGEHLQLPDSAAGQSGAGVRSHPNDERATRGLQGLVRRLSESASDQLGGVPSTTRHLDTRVGPFSGVEIRARFKNQGTMQESLVVEVRYDFDQHQFVDSKGHAISVGEHDSVLSQASAGQGAVGRRSAQRAHFAATAWSELERRGIASDGDALAWGGRAAQAGAQSGVRALADPAGHAKGHSDTLVLDGPLTMGRAFYSRPDPSPSNPTGSPLVGNEPAIASNFEKLLRPGKAALTAAKNLIEQSRPVWLGAFTLDQLVELGKKYLPQMKHYADILQALDTDRNVMQEEAGVLADDWQKWASKHQKDSIALTNLMHAATIAGTDPAEDFAPLPIVFGGKKLEATKENVKQVLLAIREQMLGRAGDSKREMLARSREVRGIIKRNARRAADHAVLRKQWNALSPEAKAMYVRVRNMYSKRRDQREAALIGRIRDMKMDDRRKQATIAQIRLMFESQRVQAPSPTLRIAHSAG